MLSDLELVYMVPRNSTQLLNINTTYNDIVICKDSTDYLKHYQISSGARASLVIPNIRKSREHFQIVFYHYFSQHFLPNSLTSQHGDSCRGGIIDNIKLGLSKYFCFSESKNQNTLISLVFNRRASMSQYFDNLIWDTFL